MRRHICCHTHCNTRSTVHQQVGETRRHYCRFGYSVVEVHREIHCILVDVAHHFLAHLCEASLGVTHSSSAVAVYRTKVTLSVNQLVAHCPTLGHTHHCIVNRRVAMRVELTKHVTHNTSRFLIRGSGKITQFLHAIKHPSVHRLETIAHIRKSSRHNHRHRIVDVCRTHLILNIDLLYTIVIHFKLIIIFYCLSCIHEPYHRHMPTYLQFIKLFYKDSKKC